MPEPFVGHRRPVVLVAEQAWSRRRAWRSRRSPARPDRSGCTVASFDVGGQRVQDLLRLSGLMVVVARRCRPTSPSGRSTVASAPGVVVGFAAVGRRSPAGARGESSSATSARPATAGRARRTLQRRRRRLEQVGGVASSAQDRRERPQIRCHLRRREPRNNWVMALRKMVERLTKPVEELDREQLTALLRRTGTDADGRDRARKPVRVAGEMRRCASCPAPGAGARGDRRPTGAARSTAVFLGRRKIAGCHPGGGSRSRASPRATASASSLFNPDLRAAALIGARASAGQPPRR